MQMELQFTLMWATGPAKKKKVWTQSTNYQFLDHKFSLQYTWKTGYLLYYYDYHNIKYKL